MDNELTNWKGGIDVVWGVGDGSDKGTSYYEEYPYHDKMLYDVKTVYLKSSTSITMSHNERNIASIGNNSRDKAVIGVGIGFSGYGGTTVGISGSGWAGGGGIIRVQCDKMWSRLHWSTGNGATYPHYTGSFNLDSLEYVTGVPVVGTTGGTTGWSNSSNWSNKDVNTGFYWRGMTDSFGDEWHILKYADDDITLGGGNWDSTASDGKYTFLVVNPKTPCLTVRASGNGQFYTTPPYVYLMPLIHQPQTTYFTGDAENLVTLELRDIYENPVAYRINSGSWISGVSSSVQLDYTNFSIGQNTLEYHYSGNEAYTKLRNVVRNPGFPSNGENHGNLLWGNASGYELVRSRLTTAPYSTTYSAFSNTSQNGQTNWASVAHSGFRIGGFTAPTNMGGDWQYPYPHINAFMAKTTNFTGYRSSSPNNKTYAAFAKEMVLETPCNIPPIGFELNQSSKAIPCQEYNYRGYWDAQWPFYAALSYDMLIADYKNTQFSGGFSPIEDYFVRDTLASFNLLSAMWIGGYNDLGSPGMWGTSRVISSAVIGLAMPSYSTPYYGTAGFDGNTGVFPWTPFETGNYTWKKLFFDADYQTGVQAPYNLWPQGLQGNAGIPNDLCLINSSGQWTDRTAYLSYSQCGQWIYMYRNLQKLYSQSINTDPLDKFLWNYTNGTLTGLKNNASFGDPMPYARGISVSVLNSSYPSLIANGMAYAKSLPTNDSNSVQGGLSEASVVGLTYYDNNADSELGKACQGKVVQNAQGNRKSILGKI